MGEIRDIKSVARPINLNNRNEKMERRKKELEDKAESLKIQARNILKK